MKLFSVTFFSHSPEIPKLPHKQIFTSSVKKAPRLSGEERADFQEWLEDEGFTRCEVFEL